jgi:hypothetical protein
VGWPVTPESSGGDLERLGQLGDVLLDVVLQLGVGPAALLGDVVLRRRCGRVVDRHVVILVDRGDDGAATIDDLQGVLPTTVGDLLGHLPATLGADRDGEALAHPEGGERVLVEALRLAVVVGEGVREQLGVEVLHLAAVFGQQGDELAGLLHGDHAFEADELGLVDQVLVGEPDAGLVRGVDDADRAEGGGRVDAAIAGRDLAEQLVRLVEAPLEGRVGPELGLDEDALLGADGEIDLHLAVLHGSCGGGGVDVDDDLVAIDHDGRAADGLRAEHVVGVLHGPGSVGGQEREERDDGQFAVQGNSRYECGPRKALGWNEQICWSGLSPEETNQNSRSNIAGLFIYVKARLVKRA